MDGKLINSNRVGSLFALGLSLVLTLCVSQHFAYAANDNGESENECSSFVCSRLVFRVCGSDGKTYANLCELKKASCIAGRLIERLHKGACLKQPEKEVTTTQQVPSAADYCDFNCPDVKRPVCGDDGKTYTNACLLRKVSCRTQTEIVKAYTGVCRDTSTTTFKPTADKGDKCNYDCPRREHKRCGSDGITYKNHCEMKKASCLSGILIKKQYSGPCVNETRGQSPSVAIPSAADYCNFDCPEVEQKVCGTDGKTYDNTCVMRKTSCQTGVEVVKLRMGACSRASTLTASSSAGKDCNFRCPRLNAKWQVCGSDGQTYANVCVMNRTGCQQDTTIAKAHNGPCVREPSRVTEAISQES